MNEEMLRSMIRESLARRLGGTLQPPASLTLPVNFPRHSSHHRFVLPESSGPCLIEPAVTCNHCGYCQSHGH